MDISKCDVVWHSPSADSLGSMPLGNGQFGANVWVTNDGLVHLYLSSTDAWDENCRLIKLGELTLETDAPISEWIEQGFRQHLQFGSACLVIQFGAPASPALTMRLWIDAHRPVLWIELDGAEDHCFR